jgi:hypothetical protein
MASMTGVLTAPTGYERGAGGFTNPFGGGLSTGIDAASGLAKFSLPAPFGGEVSKLYTNRVTPNTGFVSNTSITNTLGVAKETMRYDDIYVDTFLFADDTPDPARNGHRTSKYVRNLHVVNAFLKSEEGRRRYGHLKYYRDVLTDFRFQGQYKAGASDWQRDATHELELTTTVMGRMRVKDLFQAQLSSRGAGRKINGLVNERDYAWLLLVRCKLPDELDDMILEAERDAMDVAVSAGATGTGPAVPPASLNPMLPPTRSTRPPQYYWKYEIVTTRDRTKPPLHTYCCDSGGEDDYTGFCQFIASVGDTRGSRRPDKALTYRARKAMAGDDEWKAMLNPLPFIDIHATVK